MTPPPFRLIRPARPASAVVFASPHSGDHYAPALLARTDLDPVALRSSEDAFVDRLFDTAPDHGAPLLAAVMPRAFIDLNRDARELDPAVIDGVHADPCNARISAGLGVIPRVVGQGRRIWRGRISRAEALDRIARWHSPYHARLEALMMAAQGAHGVAILIDCHSMPGEGFGTDAMPDIVLGDRFGAACAPWVIETAEAAFATAGFTVGRNVPFAGAYSTQRYGRPAAGWHALQVEIRRGLYMDEATVRPHAGFAALRARLSAVIAELAGMAGQALPVAAE
ncbi:MAG TPA: N-formylglutamate amidohydrolase [Rhodobacteraceae bacterium]|nr:N-formylglutamate amidohydrolase [Paracoccaceae bacterium]